MRRDDFGREPAELPCGQREIIGYPEPVEHTDLLHGFGGGGGVSCSGKTADGPGGIHVLGESVPVAHGRQPVLGRSRRSSRSYGREGARQGASGGRPANRLDGMGLGCHEGELVQIHLVCVRVSAPEPPGQVVGDRFELGGRLRDVVDVHSPPWTGRKVPRGRTRCRAKVCSQDYRSSRCRRS